MAAAAAFDERAVERLASEAAGVFLSGLRSLAAAAAREAELERQRLEEEARTLAKDRVRLEEAWSQLQVERSRLECFLGASTGIADVTGMSPARRSPLASSGSLASTQRERPHGGTGPLPAESTLSGQVAPGVSGAPSPHGPVPSYCTMPVGRHCFSVLPLQEPDASSLGHDLWNQVVELPEGWEIYSALDRDFDQAMSVLARHRWGAMVLGVKNANDAYDAYWTPLFGDGSHAGQKCQEDVDWVEPVDGCPKRFRMTYSGLRVVIRQQAQPAAPAPAPAQLSLASSLAGVPPLVHSPLAASMAATLAVPRRSGEVWATPVWRGS